ncbi:60S ribosomal protein L14-2 [Capsicum annuum]|uniref:60S ribosomal protein L14-2 n=1 Tax=Capsicum annuum TaxID=4072 RepID=A0A2G2Z6W3_CAPAN|nr:60S ribosomal protein L14-2 [Capsicum annuum]
MYSRSRDLWRLEELHLLTMARIMENSSSSLTSLTKTGQGRGRSKKYWREVIRRDMEQLQLTEYMILDRKVALVDAPDMVRSQMNFKRLSLTDIKIDIKRIPKKKTLVAAMEASDVKTKWESSSWGRKLIVQKRRASLNDFDRFKLMLAKIKRAGVVRQELAKLKKEVAA